MSKKMNNLILSSANEKEKSVMEEMLRKVNVFHLTLMINFF